MSVDPVTMGSPAGALGTAPAVTPAAAAPQQQMDSAMFMKLLVTQLQNQDPSSPMDTNQMMTQTTQLSMMEKLTDLASTNQENFSLQMRMAAAGLVGKQVSYTGADGVDVSGTASSVSYAGSVPQVTVDGKVIALDSISGVTSTPAPPAT